MSAFTRSFSLPAGTYQALSVVLTGRMLRVYGGFTMNVWVLWLSPDQFNLFISGSPYHAADAHHGQQFNYTFTPPWPGTWQLVVWCPEGAGSVGQLTVDPGGFSWGGSAGLTGSF